MTTRKYWFFTLLLTLVGLPLLQVAGVVLGVLPAIVLRKWIPDGDAPIFFILIVCLVVALSFSCVAAHYYGRRISPPEEALSCYGPFLLPAIFPLGAWIAFLIVLDRFGLVGDELSVFFFYPPLDISLLALYDNLFFLIPFVILLYYLIPFWAFRVGMKKAGRSVGLFSGNIRYAHGLIGILVLVCAAQGWQMQRSIVPKEAEVQQEWGMSEEPYSAFAEESRLPRLSAPPSLQISSDYPRLDGATAFFPIYEAAARAIYVKSKDGAEDDERKFALEYSQTPYAYSRLIAGETDLIFVFAPSKEQEAAAAEQGLTLTLTPIAREAFVFLVNEQNPIQNLTLQQIRAIYSGEIDDWREVGGAAGRILAFQRPSGSGSQTIMEKVMGDMPLRKPLRERLSIEMSSLLYAVGTASYRNSPAALGYSFRFYATGMNPVPGVKLLAIDGIEPTAENIRNGRYPLIFDVYMVSARPLSANAQKLRDWFLDDEGQRLIAEVGYVPISPPSRTAFQ